MRNGKIIKICEQKFIYLNYSPRTTIRETTNIDESFQNYNVTTKISK